MSLQVEKLEKGMARLTIEVSAERFEKAVNAVYLKERGRINIPGFRKGKIPRKLIEQMYGKGVFYEDAANDLISEAYEEELKNCGEKVVSQPKINVVQIESGKPFIFTAEVALKPEVTLGLYRGVEVKAADLDVTEEEIDAQVNTERENSARTIPVEDRPVRDGDITVIDFEGFVDGVAFEGGKGSDYTLTIGSGTFIPGFEEALVGAEIGRETDVHVTFPEDYQAQELAGKAAVFKCTVKEIKEKELPELDDEFASEVSEFETLAEYRDDIRKKIAEEKAENAADAKREAVIEAVIEGAGMEIPDAMLETQQYQMLEDFAERLKMYGMTMEQYFENTNTNVERMLLQFKPRALKNIQTRLVLEAVAEAEHMEATEEEFEAEVAKMAEEYKMEADKVKEILDRNGREQVLDNICINKALDFVVENAREAAPKAMNIDAE